MKSGVQRIASFGAQKQGVDLQIVGELVFEGEMAPEGLSGRQCQPILEVWSGNRLCTGEMRRLAASQRQPTT